MLLAASLSGAVAFIQRYFCLLAAVYIQYFDGAANVSSI